MTFVRVLWRSVVVFSGKIVSLVRKSRRPAVCVMRRRRVCRRGAGYGSGFECLQGERDRRRRFPGGRDGVFRRRLCRRRGAGSGAERWRNGAVVDTVAYGVWGWGFRPEHGPVFRPVRPVADAPGLSVSGGRSSVERPETFFLEFFAPKTER